MRNANTRRPLYQEVRNRIAQGIANGHYPVGSELPSIAEMNRLYAASPSTIARVIELLRGERLIRCSQGRRPRVRQTGRQRDCFRIAILLDTPDRNCVYDYTDGASTWLLHQKIMQRLLRDHHPVINLSYRYDWEAHCDHIDGVVALEARGECRREPDKLRKYGIPCVKFAYFLPDPPASNTLTLDYAPAMAQIAIYFLSNGCKAVFINDLEYPENGAKSRTEALRQTLSGHGFPSERIFTRHFPPMQFTPDDLMEIRAYLLRTAGPVGILTAGDMQTSQILELAADCRLTLKKDFFVVGISGLPESTRCNPVLSTIEIPFDNLADQIVNMLYQLLQNHVDEIASQLIPLRFAPRGT